MTDQLTIALAQLNPTVGDIAGNAALVRAARARAAGLGADLLVASELVIPGYPPEDLVLRQSFQEAAARAVDALAAETADGGPALLVGSLWVDHGRIYNAALLLDGGRIAAVRLKHELPNYGVFDEKRVFAAGPLPGPVNFRDVRLGIMVCEDMWQPDVTECLEESGAELLVVLNGSPYALDKWDERLNLAVARIGESGLPLIYVNQVGGQDELVFDGGSFVLDAGRRLRARCPDWAGSVLATVWRRGEQGWSCDRAACAAPQERLASIYSAMMLGLRDYVGKNRFPGVLIGLSGGIDSALTAAIAQRALGADNVLGVAMPSRYSSEHSARDATELAHNLGIAFQTISIDEPFSAFLRALAPAFGDRAPDVAEENIQARSRAVILMALSNKLGHLLLTTGNKSELAVGYCTLYGDMSGGLALISDVPKTMVYELAREVNRQAGAAVIPESTLTKPPSAELRPDQTDQDSLPPYDVLDRIVELYVVERLGADEIRAMPDFDRATVDHVLRLVRQSEYKRRQAAPGLKVTTKAFGTGRRMPIAQRWRG